MLRLESGTANLPAAAERLVQADQARHNVATGLRQLILLRGQFSLHDKYAREADRTVFEGDRQQSKGLLRFRHTCFQKLDTLLVSQKGDQRIFHFLIGRQHGVLVTGNQFLKARRLKLYVVDDPSVVEQVPAERRTDRPGAARARRTDG